MDRETAGQRVGLVRTQMTDRDIACLVVSKTENVTYLTGFMGHDSWVVIVGRKVALVTDSRYTEQARGECAGCRIVERKGPITKAVADIIGRHESITMVAVEDSMTVGVLNSLKKALKMRVKPVGGIVEEVRRGKSAAEVRLISRAARLGWEVLDAAMRQLRAGITESEAAGILEFEMRKRGVGPGFETIMAFGPNGSRNHHQPGRRKLRKRDTILVDFGVKVGGYCSDVTRCFAFGGCSRRYREVYEGVAAAQKTAISVVKAGVKLAEVDAAAKKELERRGLPIYGHGTGHGIGLAVHEGPFMAKRAKGELREGDVITVEPGVYIPGSFGVRIEDDVLVLKNGCRVISEDRKYGFFGEKLRVF